MPESIDDAIIERLDAIRDKVLTDARMEQHYRGYHHGAGDISRLVLDVLNRRVEGPDPAPDDVALRDHFRELLAPGSGSA